MTKKRKYEKPSQRVIELQQRTMLLAGSNGTNPYTPDNNPYNW